MDWANYRKLAPWALGRPLERPRSYCFRGFCSPEPSSCSFVSPNAVAPPGISPASADRGP